MSRCPANVMLPALAGMSPAMALSVVVFPAPLEPSSATTLPAGTSSETSADADQVAVAHFQILDAQAAGWSWRVASAMPARARLPR